MQKSFISLSFALFCFIFLSLFYSYIEIFKIENLKKICSICKLKLLTVNLIYNFSSIKFSFILMNKSETKDKNCLLIFHYLFLLK